MEREDPGDGHPDRAGGRPSFPARHLVLPAVRPPARPAVNPGYAGHLCLEVGEAGSGDEALHHLSAALSVIETFGAWSSANRVRGAIVGANLQRGAYDEAERELKLTTPHGADEFSDMPMFDTVMRAEIALGRGDIDTGLDL